MRRLLLLLLLLVLRQPVQGRVGAAAEEGPPRRPLLAPWLRVAEDGDALLLSYGGELVRFDGRAATTLLPALLPLLDGTRTLDEVVERLGARVRPAVEQAVALLDEHRLLTDGPPLDPDLPDPVAATAELLAASGGIAPAAARERLVGAHVGVVGEGANAAELGRALRLAGVGRVDRSEGGAELVLVAPDALGDDLLPGWNERALAAGITWLQVLPFDGSFAAVGPLYLPGETCCHRCFELRRAANLEFGDELGALRRVRAPVATPPALAATVSGLATLQALRWLVLRDPYVPGSMLAVTLTDTPRVESHFVHRVPRCPACSVTARQAAPLPWAESA